MAKTHQMTTGGALLRTTTSGKIQGECCCESGCGPNACGGGEPQMCLTVFDADYAGGDITWCGVTWTQADVQAGATKAACPGSQYTRQLSTYTYPYTVKVGRHAWLSSGIGNGFGLRLARTYHNNVFSAVKQAFQNVKLGNTTTPSAPGGWDSTIFINAVTPSTLYSTLGLISGVPAATFGVSGYTLTSAFFGSHTSGGVKYSWAQGEDW